MAKMLLHCNNAFKMDVYGCKDIFAQLLPEKKEFKNTSHF